jgi:uncharacterized protein
MGSFRVWEGVSHLAEERWQALSTAASPFHEYGFLASLEETGCVGQDSGWDPLIFGFEENNELVAVMPAYIKTHSMGEFVYDWSFADSASRAGLGYYPKLVVTAPFSPISGKRFLFDPSLGEEKEQKMAKDLLENAIDEAKRRGCHSVNLLFCTEEEGRIAEELGFCERLAVQLHWENAGYACFDDFLARFNSKRRKEIKRERRHLREAGIEVKHLNGADEAIPVAHHHEAYRFYSDTVQRFQWGRQYLSEAFFKALFERLNHRLQFSVAYRDGVPMAGAFNLEKDGRRYGRYWGADEAVRFLHFEVCSYGPVQDAINRKVDAFEAGAGTHTHKFYRGFSPKITRSAHLYFHDGFHRAIEVYCQREAKHVRREVEDVAQSVFVR